MDCRQATELLSAYVDDALDPVTKAEVEEHLAGCPTCATELASLRTYLEAMSSLSPVRAPADFLTSVHERLEQPGWFKRLMAWLFFPVKTKLPFEMAGLVAASLLVVLLYHGTGPEKAQITPVSPPPSYQAPAAPAPSTPTSPAAIPATPARPSAERSMEASRPPAGPRLGVEESKKDDIRTLPSGPPPQSAQTGPAEDSAKAAPVPLRERAEPPHASRLAPHPQAPAPAPSQERSKTPVIEPLSATPSVTASAAASTPVELVLRLRPPADLPAAPRDVSREQPLAGASSTTTAPHAQEPALTRKAAPAPMRAAEKAESTAPASPATTLARIKELVEQAKGSIVSVEHEQTPSSLQVVAAQVPARNLPAFLKELRRLGQLEEPDVPPKLANRDAMIQLRIRLMPPG